MRPTRLSTRFEKENIPRLPSALHLPADMARQIQQLRNPILPGDNYLRMYYGNEVQHAYAKLEKSLNDLFATKPGFTKLTLIICFDEASHLCTSSAVTGETINPAKDEDALILPTEVDSCTFSNFRAMTRALH